MEPNDLKIGHFVTISHLLKIQMEIIDIDHDGGTISLMWMTPKSLTGGYVIRKFMLNNIAKELSQGVEYDYE